MGSVGPAGAGWAMQRWTGSSIACRPPMRMPSIDVGLTCCHSARSARPQAAVQLQHRAGRGDHHRLWRRGAAAAGRARLARRAAAQLPGPAEGWAGRDRGGVWLWVWVLMCGRGCGRWGGLMGGLGLLRGGSILSCPLHCAKGSSLQPTVLWARALPQSSSSAWPPVASAGHVDKSLFTQLAVDTREVFLSYTHNSGGQAGPGPQAARSAGRACATSAGCTLLLRVAGFRSLPSSSSAGVAASAQVPPRLVPDSRNP